jgi:hypothetical protein
VRWSASCIKCLLRTCIRLLIQLFNHFENWYIRSTVLHTTGVGLRGVDCDARRKVTVFAAGPGAVFGVTGVASGKITAICMVELLLRAHKLEALLAVCGNYTHRCALLFLTARANVHVLSLVLSTALYHLCDMDVVCLGGLRYGALQSLDIMFSYMSSAAIAVYLVGDATSGLPDSSHVVIGVCWRRRTC